MRRACGRTARRTRSATRPREPPARRTADVETRVGAARRESTPLHCTSTARPPPTFLAFLAHQHELRGGHDRRARSASVASLAWRHRTETKVRAPVDSIRTCAQATLRV